MAMRRGAKPGPRGFSARERNCMYPFLVLIKALASRILSAGRSLEMSYELVGDVHMLLQ